MAGTQVVDAIKLKGSTDIVAEYFYYGVNNILYQRGIYPPESFSEEKKFGLSLFVSEMEELKKYLEEVMSQVKEWLTSMMLEKLVIVIRCADTNEVLERWQFDVEDDRPGTKENSNPVPKSLKTVQEEIRAVMRQITATVTFLPLLETPCNFEVLVYTHKDLVTPDTWGETGPQFIANSSQVRMRSFTTKIHKVNTCVSYKKTD
ncbi:mitotic spindle assembly checkpoint protein MAD2A-like [Argonauta hians]